MLRELFNLKMARQLSLSVLVAYIEGRTLYNLVKDNKFTRTLEIGFAMGTSAVWICQAFKDGGLKGTHIAIDPNQTSQYNSIGLFVIEKCGLSDFFSMMEYPSYRALPNILEQVITKKLKKFQLIYIDGWHTFDYTLLDFFYSDLILEVGGAIVVDDIRHKSVKKAIEYIKKNYKHYKLVHNTPCYNHSNLAHSTQATFVKVNEDRRPWNFHVNF